MTCIIKLHYFLFSSAPCPPLNIQSTMNCGSNTASVSWSGGNGALSFTMTMECSNGQTYSCSTNETGCDITNMACGQTCTVKVAAEGRSCNSSAGVGSPVITGNHFEHNHSKIWGQKKHTLIKQGCIQLTDIEVKVKTFIMSRKNYILNKCYFKRIFPPKLLSSTIVFNIKSKSLWIKASAKWINVNVNINKK